MTIINIVVVILIDAGPRRYFEIYTKTGDFVQSWLKDMCAKNNIEKLRGRALWVDHPYIYIYIK